MTLIYIILAIILLLVIWVIGSYNRLITMGNRAKEAWADIDVQLKRRYDLIPNLVSTVKGYATHESSAFENVTKARAAAMGAGSPAAKGAAESMLAGALKSVFAIAEAYPELKANQNFLALQNELTDTEDKIQAARRFY
ncbi:MAG: LemA protein, partial [Candidatus Parcubacteria bacterium]|nr:LemA protein [Candidatus Parcubacteria bacterium]